MTATHLQAASHRKPIVIVGGGVVGICSAFYLQQAGLPVLLLEADKICGGASLGNLGLLAASHSIPMAAPGVLQEALSWLLQADAPVKMSAPFDLERARWIWQFFRSSRSSSFPARATAMVAFTHMSIALYRELGRDILEHAGFSHKGLVELFSSPEVFAKARAKLPLLRRCGLNVEALDAGDTQRLEPYARSSVAGSFYFADDCHLKPYEFAMELARQAQAGGAIFRENAPVDQLESNGTMITAVRVAGERVEVSSVVLAAGAASVQLTAQLGLRLPVQPGRGYAFDAPSWADPLRHPLMLAEAHVVLVPMGEHVRIGGILDIAGEDQPAKANRARVVTKRLSEFLDPSPETDCLNFWSGLRPCSADGLPIIGASRTFRNLLLATGHGMLGLTQAPATGLLIRDILLERPSKEQWDEFSPRRLSSVL